MKKNIVFLIFLLISLNVFSNDAGNVLIKRNVLVIPFVNSNNDQKYDFLKDAISDAIKANLMNTNQFNLSNPLEIDKKISEMGFYKEKILEPANAIAIAKSLKSDVVVVGKFIAIDDKVMIQIQAIDVFTEEIVIVTNQSGSLGINLLKLIDNVSKNLSVKMAEKFPKVDRSYFTEMRKIMNENDKRNKIKFNLTPVNYAGIGLCAGGITLLLSGISMLIYDFAGYSTVLQGYKDNYTRTKTDFDGYESSYNIFIGLFISSVVLSSVGFIMAIVSIPLIIYKKKNKEFSLSLEFSPDPGLFLSCKF